MVRPAAARAALAIALLSARVPLSCAASRRQLSHSLTAVVGAEDGGAGDWTGVTPAAPWGTRSAHTAVVLRSESDTSAGTVVLMGGLRFSDFHFYNDVWRSDGAGAAMAWGRATNAAEWSARSGHASVVLHTGSSSSSAIILMGGTTSLSGNMSNEVWRSDDGGVTWAGTSAAASWSGRYSHAAVVVPSAGGATDVLVLMGGYDGTTRNDVWSSADAGATWQLSNPEALWSPRFGHKAAVLPDSGDIVLCGGSDATGAMHFNDVWRSSDAGTTWHQVTAVAPWAARGGHTLAVQLDGSMVVMAGFDGTNYLNDVWVSAGGGGDGGGRRWAQATAAAEWSGRDSPACAVLPGTGEIVLTGGGDKSGATLNDVWVSAGGNGGGGGGGGTPSRDRSAVTWVAIVSGAMLVGVAGAAALEARRRNSHSQGGGGSYREMRTSA